MGEVRRAQRPLRTSPTVKLIAARRNLVLVHVSVACPRLQMLSEEFGDALEVELVGRALEGVRLAGVLEVLDLFARGPEAGQQIARPFVWHGLICRAPMDLYCCAHVV